MRNGIEIPFFGKISQYDVLNPTGAESISEATSSLPRHRVWRQPSTIYDAAECAVTCTKRFFVDEIVDSLSGDVVAISEEAQ